MLFRSTPNPFNQTLSVSVKSTESKVLKSNYKVELLNENGSVIAARPIVSNTALQFNTAAYPAGVYFLNLKSSDGVSQSVQVVKINK